ncbi:ANK1 [Symbiodinium natans]|uniref:ANK1 protein n=1 Tax=Symbiodinium natans TaxID=878477 RepID=A0A812GPG1_9DINO|nr:ANK1 [Symbiodinium natans]
MGSAASCLGKASVEELRALEAELPWETKARLRSALDLAQAVPAWQQGPLSGMVSAGESWLFFMQGDPFCLLENPNRRQRDALLADREYMFELVRQTQASFLWRMAAQELREDPSFVSECERLAGTGLVFRYYKKEYVYKSMREHFPTASASVPGGLAYAQVMDKIKIAGGHTATVWFDEQPVFGHIADDGRWVHPSQDCGRDDVPVPPPEQQDAKWKSTVDSRSSSHKPNVGERHPCWCCHWLRLVRKRHAEGDVICCTTSNIYFSDWVEKFGAGSSELSDAKADELGLPRETFRNGRPEEWGEGRILLSAGQRTDREAPIHPRTKLPLGSGCRWERSVLDSLEFPVYAFFIP